MFCGVAHLVRLTFPRSGAVIPSPPQRVNTRQQVAEFARDSIGTFDRREMLAPGKS